MSIARFVAYALCPVGAVIAINAADDSDWPVYVQSVSKILRVIEDSISRLETKIRWMVEGLDQKYPTTSGSNEVAQLDKSRLIVQLEAESPEALKELLNDIKRELSDVHAEWINQSAIISYGPVRQKLLKVKARCADAENRIVTASGRILPYLRREGSDNLTHTEKSNDNLAHRESDDDSMTDDESDDDPMAEDESLLNDID